MASTVSPAGWYADPSGQGEARYWNGVAWTQSVSRGGVEVESPLNPSQVSIPPAPGTGVAPPVKTQSVGVSSSRRSPLGVIVGVFTVLLIVVLIVVLVNDGDSPAETPSPATDAPAEEPAPADEPAPTEGG
jgi:hypothetical protein